MKKLLKIMIVTMLVSPVSVGFVADKPNTASPATKGDYTKSTTIAEAKSNLMIHL